MTKKKTLKKKECAQLDANPYYSKGYMDCKSTVLSTRLLSSMQKINENIGYMQKVVNREKDQLFPSTMVLFFRCCSLLICSYE